MPGEVPLAKVNHISSNSLYKISRLKEHEKIADGSHFAVRNCMAFGVNEENICDLRTFLCRFGRQVYSEKKKFRDWSLVGGRSVERPYGEGRAG